MIDIRVNDLSEPRYTVTYAIETLKCRHTILVPAKHPHLIWQTNPAIVV